MKEEKSKEKKNYWKPYFKIMFWIFAVTFVLLLFDKSPLYGNFFIALFFTISVMFIVSPFYLVYIYFYKEKKLREHEIKDDKKIIENVYKKFELKDWKRNISAILPICLFGFLMIIGFIWFLASTPTPQKIVYNKQDLLKNNIDEIEDVSDVKVINSAGDSSLVVSLFALYEPSFTESMVVLGNDREGMLYKSSQIFKKVFPMDSSISIVRVYVYKYEKDAYGNKIKKDLGSVELPRQEYNKINWEGFSSHNLPKIAKVDYEIHNEREAQIEAMKQYMGSNIFTETPKQEIKEQFQNQIIKEETQGAETIATPLEWEFNFYGYDSYPFLFIEYYDKTFDEGIPFGYVRVFILPTNKKQLDDSRYFLPDCTDKDIPPDGTIKHCSTPLQIKKAQLDNKEVYVIIQIGESLKDQDKIFNKSIEELRKMDTIKIFKSFVPPIDDKGFVPIQYVSKTWCDYYLSGQDRKQGCENFIEQMKKADCSPEFIHDDDKFSNVCIYFDDISRGIIAYR